MKWVLLFFATFTWTWWLFESPLRTLVFTAGAVALFMAWWWGWELWSERKPEFEDVDALVARERRK